MTSAFGMDRIQGACVAAVDEVLHHGVADLALSRGGADDGDGVGLHDAAHGDENLLLAGPVARRRGLLEQDAGIDGAGVVGGREHGIQIEFVDFGNVADQPADGDDQRYQRGAVDAGGAANAIEHRGSGDLVEHGRGLFLRSRARAGR